MKKQVLLISAVILLVFPSLCLASYIIELNNGHKFITPQWWKEGAIIKFYLYGGVIGIHRSTIKQIESSSLAVPPAPAPVKSTAPKEETGQEENAKESTAGSREETAAPDPEQLQNYLIEKQDMDRQRAQAYADFNNAKRDNNNAAFEKARGKLRQSDQQLKALLEKSKAANNGQTPDWWNK